MKCKVTLSNIFYLAGIFVLCISFVFAFMSGTSEIFLLETWNFTNISNYEQWICLLIMWKIFWALTYGSHIFSSFVTFILITPELFVLDASNFIHINLCILCRHINNMGSILSASHLAAIFGCLIWKVL